MWKEMCCLLLLKWVIKCSFENEKRMGINQFQDQLLTHLSHLTHTVKVFSFFHPVLEADREWFSAFQLCVQRGEGELNISSSSFEHKS